MKLTKTKGAGDQLADGLDDRKRLIFAAVQSLLMHSDVAPLIAATPTAEFVQMARAAFKRNGLTFSDDELRSVHDGLKILIEARMAGAEAQTDGRN